MTDDTVRMTEAENSRRDFIDDHLYAYLNSGGVDGHIVDFTDIGGLRFTTTLLLETHGRTTGCRRINPLIYGDTQGKVVVIASKGGADIHPAWYLNLLARPQVKVQIATQAFSGTWYEAQGTEYEALWDFMADLFPPYHPYRAGTGRRIPVIVIEPGAPVPRLAR